MPDAIKALDAAGLSYDIITPEEADKVSKVNSKSMVLLSYCRNESGYYEIKVKEKGFYRWTRKLLGDPDQCNMRLTGFDEKTRTVTAEDDYQGKVLNVIQILAMRYNLAIVKS